ncbi:MAG: hypothetical protein WD928_17075 [Gammaproteobacteria bacterium]
MRSSRVDVVRRQTSTAIVLALIVVLGIGAVLDADARQFRGRRPIATPEAVAARLPDGAQPVIPIVPLTREQVHPALERLIDAWNSGRLAPHLDTAFYDRTRLTDALDTLAPRNARLYLQAVEGVQTLQQYVEDDPARPAARRLISRVSVTARTQIEFEGDVGFVRRSGINEFLLRIEHQEIGP